MQILIKCSVFNQVHSITLTSCFLSLKLQGKPGDGVKDYFLILDIEQLNRGPDTGDWSQ